MDHDLLIKAYKAAQKGQSYAFATVIESTPKGTPRKAGAKMVVLRDGSLFGSIGGGRNEKAAKEECLKAIERGIPALVTYDYFGEEGQSVCGGQMKVFIEPFVGQKEFIICGGGHIALPLSVLVKMLGFKVILLDNRPEFASKERFPHVDKIVLGEYAEKFQGIPVDSETYVMVVTQGNEFDFECLKIALRSKAAYIGVISSKAKKIKFFNRLKKMGISEKSLKRINIPAGIDLGAQTPEEIAVSIAAEIVKYQNVSLVGTDKFREK